MAVGLALLLAVVATPASAAGDASPTETNVTNGLGAGEPETALDAVHHTMVTAFTTTNSVCGIALSADGGQSWQVSTAFPADPGPTLGIPYHNCSDPVAASGPDGTLYVGGGWWDQPAGAIDYYNIYVARSTDGGRTWSKAVFATGDSDAADILALGRNSGHSDRAFMTVDSTSGTVYVSAVDFPRNQRWVVASHDHGASFGKPHAIDSADYPEAGGQPMGDYIPSAAGDRLGFTYVAAAVPGVNNCPCNIFETSGDDGATWTRHFTPLAANWVAADPSRPDHFAIMSGSGTTAATSTPDYVTVSVTLDGGQTWSTPTLIGQAPPNPRSQPWMNFSARGVLGVGYKTVYGTSVNTAPYDFWSAVSCDGGFTFSVPVRMSHDVSSAEDLGGDDFSFVALDAKNLYAGWGDMRTTPADPTPGDRSVYLGTVPLNAYTTADGSPLICSTQH